MVSLQDLHNVIISGDYEKGKNLTQELIVQGVSAADILNKGLLPGMEIVGRKFKADELYIPEVLMSAKAMQDAMDIIKPLLSETEFVVKDTIVIGTVHGDVHSIGKGIVGMMLEGAGYKVIDIGIDVSSNKFVEMTKKNNAKIVGLSALLTTTISAMQDVINALRTDPETKKVKVIVGGSPVTQGFANSIGADGYAYDAITAVDLVNNLLK